MKEAGGFLITSIKPGGPADKYGLQAADGLQAAEMGQTDTGTRTMTGGDIILKIGNQ